MLLAMFIRWEVIGHPIYPSMEAGQTIAYISDVGAYGLKPLFITGSVITTISLDLAFMAERWLRHTGRLVPNTSRAQKVLSVLAIICAVAGSAGLILLSIFDTYHHNRLHNGFLLLFIGGFILSAVFLCAEYQRLGIHYREHRILRISFWVKLAFILIEFALAVVFVSTTFTHNRNVAAVFEWIVALVFTFYILSFLLDLLPSVRSRNHQPQGWRNTADAEKANGTHAPLGADSQGPNSHNDDGNTLPSNGAYRGTTMTNGSAHPPTTSNQQHGDLGRQKKWGVGKFRF